jgi:hypothetical protein
VTDQLLTTCLVEATTGESRPEDAVGNESDKGAATLDQPREDPGKDLMTEIFVRFLRDLLPGSLVRLLRAPEPVRWTVIRLLDARMNFLGYTAKLDFESIDRPHYGSRLLHAAFLAKKLGHDRIAAIEFGVAGGNGLLALEMHADDVARVTGVRVSVYGFDSGTGMPSPSDFRDLPYLWQSGYYKMDVERLRARLRGTKLVLGPIEETVPAFCELENPPPIGFIAFDLDYYSSTKSALCLFTAPHNYLLPRVFCYFDDIVGDIDMAINEYTGELLAIREFNDSHEEIKIAPVRGLRFLGQVPRLSRSLLLTCSLTPTIAVQSNPRRLSFRWPIDHLNPSSAVWF